MINAAMTIQGVSTNITSSASNSPRIPKVMASKSASELRTHQAMNSSTHLTPVRRISPSVGNSVRIGNAPGKL